MIKPPKRHRFSPTSQEVIWVHTSGEQSIAVEGLDEELLAAGFQPVPFHDNSKSFMDYLPSFLTPKQNTPHPADTPTPHLGQPPLTAAGAAATAHEIAAAFTAESALPISDAFQTSRRLKTPARMLAMPQLPRSWKPSAVRKRRFTYRPVALLPLACLLGGLLAGYFLPKFFHDRAGLHGSSVPVETLAEKPADRLTPSEQADLDAAYAAQKTGRYAEATELFTALQRKHPAWGAMGIEIGATQIYQHDLTTARASLESSLKGTMTADAKSRLGMLSAIRRDYAQAESYFAAAVALDPSRADFYYLWGDCLRQQGKPLEAISKFRSALLRNQYETSEGLYRLKLWLCEIQANQENADGADAQIEAALAHPRPPMEALFAAAAQDLKAGQTKEAADRLIRARELVTPNIFFVIMHDPSFIQESWRPELAELFVKS